MNNYLIPQYFALALVIFIGIVAVSVSYLNYDTTLQIQDLYLDAYLDTIENNLTSSVQCPIIDQQMQIWKKEIDDFWRFDKSVAQTSYDALLKKHIEFCLEIEGGKI